MTPVAVQPMTPATAVPLAAVVDRLPSMFQVVFGRTPRGGELLLVDSVLVVGFLGLVLFIAMMAIWMERKVAGHIQSRMGPNRVGWFGLLQSLSDGIKLLTKEDLRPDCADGLMFRLAPYLAFAPVFAAFLALPFGPSLTFEPGLNVGVFWILAILSVEVMGVILAGWASNNKWAIYGAMREACQMVSYEIPLGLAIIVGVMTAGTLNMLELSVLQGGGLHTWLVFRNPFVFAAFFVYFIASLASNKRAPFDLPESESELVAGYHTEYSGMRFGFFFFGEYAAMFVVAGIQTALFLGGWNDPFGIIGARLHSLMQGPIAEHRGALLTLNAVAAGVFAVKCTILVYVQMWVRWTLPRPRIDQVLYACMKVLLPLACALLLGAGLWQLLVPERPGVPWWDYQPYAWEAWSGSLAALITQGVLSLGGVVALAAVVGWIVLAIGGGRSLKKRLTEAAPIGAAQPVGA